VFLTVLSSQVRSQQTNRLVLSNESQQPEPLPAPLPEAPLQAETGLTFAELEQMALTFNPSLSRAAALVGAARGTWVQSGLAPNPSVGYEGQQLGSGGLAEQQGVLFSQEIVRGGKLRLNRAVAERDLSVARQDVAAQQLRVLTDVRIAFYQVLLAQRQIDLTQNLIRISDEGSRAADNLFQAREAGRTDVLQSQLEVENAQILAQNARHRHDAAWRSLAAVTGNPLLPPQPLVGDVAAPPKNFDFDETIARIYAMSPEILAAKLEIGRAQVALERARVEPVPNINVQGLVNAQDNGIGGKPDGGIAVTIPVPLFNRNQGNILRAQHEIIAARRALSQIELDLQNRLAPTFEQYTNARGQVIRYQDRVLPAAQESLELTRKMYEAGELNYVGLLTVQRTFSQTHLSYLDALRSLRVAEVEIEGLLLRGSLQYRLPGSGSRDPGSGERSMPIGGVELFHR
jgi:cobalt-zinc-cadmium efflux system outer membrane protein